ncbi:MAG: hypothetical protein D4R81_04445 [Nitrospiraceae bacterium]|nr:MAG: hypothetical protein D4R81_04445 [Nitrospiraceae bacterium]
MKDYYDILEVPPNATQEEIKQAWREQLQVWHPDRFLHNPSLRSKAEEKAKEINEAYETLGNQQKRQTYGGERSAQRKASGRTSEDIHAATSAKTEDYGENIGHVYPWRRYFARMTDYVLFGLVSGIFIVIFAPSVFDSNDLFLNITGSFAWIFIEASLLSSWGTTPGKWLLEIKLRNSNGNKLAFASALNRSFSVWLKGIGVGFPIASLMTMAIAYGRLKRERTTSWDEAGGIALTYKKLVPAKLFLVVLLFVGIILLIVYGRK